MKIALLAANGRYVCAENGGGIDTRLGGVAIRANRPEVGAWETFIAEEQPGGFWAIRTDSGNYVTAELGGGGALRTNAIDIGPWEMFKVINKHDGTFGLRSWDGLHFVCAEVGSADPVVNATRIELNAWESFKVINLAPAPVRPTRDQILDVKGNFISIRDSQNRVMLSWFWANLPEIEQADWETRWRAAGLTHIVMCPVMQYGNQTALPSDDWRAQPERFAAAVGLALDRGFIPIIQMTSGDGGTGNDVQTYWPNLLAALRPHLPYVMVTPGFEVVGPGGGWSSRQLSNGLMALKAANPGAIGVHLQPERATGASNPVEPDDPWHGDEAGFWTAHGGQYVDCLLYQTPHGDKLLNRSGAAPGVGAWEDRWNEILDRLGKGALGWRQVRCVLFEKTGMDYYHGAATDADVTWTSNRGKILADERGVQIGYGDGLPG